MESKLCFTQFIHTDVTKHSNDVHHSKIISSDGLVLVNCDVDSINKHWINCVKYHWYHVY